MVVFTLTGPEMQTKYILRCRNCRLNDNDQFDPSKEDHRQDVWYHPDMVKLKQISHIIYIYITHISVTNTVV